MPEPEKTEPEIEIVPGNAADTAATTETPARQDPAPRADTRRGFDSGEIDEKERQRRATIRQRIDQLTYQKRELERINVDLTNQLAAARRAQMMADQAVVLSMEEATEQAIDAAERELAEAQAAGDTPAAVKATTKLSMAAARKAEIERMKLQAGFTGEKPLREQVRERPLPMPEPTPAPQRQQVGPMTQAWFERNPWFHTEPEKRAVALAVNQKVLALGYKPETQDYYDKLDQELEQEFGERLDGGAEVDDDGAADVHVEPAAPARPAAQQRSTLSRPAASHAPQRTVPGVRGAPTMRRTLTEEEAQMAKSLGISPLAYWEQKQAIEAKKKGR